MPSRGLREINDVEKRVFSRGRRETTRGASALLFFDDGILGRKVD
jgi:hypothetical protein